MPISPDHAPRVYPPTVPYEVGRAKIAEFAAALGDANPAYVGPDAIAPPTFAAVIAAPAWDALFADPELGLSLARTVHVDQRFEWTRPLRVGDQVAATLSLDKVRARGRAAFIGITVTLTDATGAEICRATSTLMHSQEA